MTRTDVRAWQRAFEWTLDRAPTPRIRKHNHDLMDHVQVVELATKLALDRGGDRELLDDVLRAAGELKALAKRLADPVAPPATCDGAAAIAAALARLHDVRATVSVTGEVRATSEELEHVVVGMVLAFGEAATELLARVRVIDGAPWLELVAGAPTAVVDDHEVAVLEAICARRGGELTRSERKGGGEELSVALRA